MQLFLICRGFRNSHTVGSLSKRYRWMVFERDHRCDKLWNSIRMTMSMPKQLHVRLEIFQGIPLWLAQVEAKFGNQIAAPVPSLRFPLWLAQVEANLVARQFLKQTKPPPRQARWRAAMWFRDPDLVARRGFHPRKVDGERKGRKASFPLWLALVEARSGNQNSSPMVALLSTSARPSGSTFGTQRC